MALNLKAIHPEPRESAAPAGGKRVASNPPALLWPAAPGKTVRYSVRLSQGPRFPKRSTILAEGLRPAMFNPHRRLETGTWYWQYGVSKRGRELAWSEAFTFEVPRSARVSETPTSMEMVAACPQDHPRLWVTSGGLEALRRRLKGSDEAAQFVQQSVRYVGEDLPDDTAPPDRGDTDYEVRTYRRWASKALAAGVCGSVQWLAPAYVMTGDERIGREAVRRALHVAGWDPDGFTDWEVSDFADGSCMRVMAQTYDSCFDLLSEEERATLRKAMTARAGRFFETVVNDLEARVFAAHIWQHILLEFAEVAFATLHEVPEAEAWASYVYEIWLAKFPLMGGNDGGWANGNSYFGSNIETLLSIPALFRHLVGIDLYENPWYRSAIDFMIYTWPPGSCPDGFGDGAEQQGHPTGARLAFVEALGKVFRDPYASWYVQKSREEGTGRSRLSPMQTLNRMLRDGRTGRVRPRSPRGLPQAKAFRDVGIVSMHTDLVDAAKDLMVGFRSSPYGSFGHAHAGQNSFNLLCGGERLFHNTGYYIAYGDDHFLGWYKHTKGHNSVLIDGQGQVFGSSRTGRIVRHWTEGYGWVPRFLNGRRIAYCLGDASDAYGDAGLVRFRRHLVLLRPSTVVVYDDLEADHPAEWSCLLHSVRRMTVNARQHRLRTKVRTARAQANIIGSGPLGIAVDDRFDPPALNWRGKAIDGKVPDEFPKQWHATASPAEPCEGMRFLTVIQVRAADAPSDFADLPTEADGDIQVGDWRVQAEMDASRKASLVVRHLDGRTVLGADVPSVAVGKKRYRTGRPNASILVESLGRAPVVQRSADELPEAAR